MQERMEKSFQKRLEKDTRSSQVDLNKLYVFSWRVLPLAFGDYPVLSVPMLPVLS
jgi:hypothetical protein